MFTRAKKRNCYLQYSKDKPGQPWAHRAQPSRTMPTRMENDWHRTKWALPSIQLPFCSKPPNYLTKISEYSHYQLLVICPQPYIPQNALSDISAWLWSWMNYWMPDIFTCRSSQFDTFFTYHWRLRSEMESKWWQRCKNCYSSRVPDLLVSKIHYQNNSTFVPDHRPIFQKSRDIFITDYSSTVYTYIHTRCLVRHFCLVMEPNKSR